MSPRALWLTVISVGVGLGVGVGCDRAAPGGGTNAATAAKSSTAPATQPASDESNGLSAVERMVADSATSTGASPALPVLPPGHPPVPGMSLPSAATKAPNLPPGHPSLRVMGSMPSLAGIPDRGIPLKWDNPADWKPVRPATTFRKAQYEVPPAGGEGTGQVAVFHFPGSGGSVKDNVARWVAQFSDADGKPIDPATVKQKAFEANGLRVHFVEVSGYMLVSRTMGGTGKRGADQYRLLGGIVEMPDGSWFFKGTGPDKTMSAAREAFLQMLRSVHAEQAAAGDGESPGSTGTP